MLTPDQTQDFDALLPGQSTVLGASRRTALKVALGVGYAAAATPIMAQTAIKTSSEGLTTGEAIYDVEGFSVPFFYAAPEGKKNLPVILVVHEIFGVHEYIADTCRRLAKAGYLAIAPELYARQGDPSSYGEMAKLMAEVVSKVPDAQVMGEVERIERDIEETEISEPEQEGQQEEMHFILHQPDAFHTAPDAGQYLFCFSDQEQMRPIGKGNPRQQDCTRK